MAVRRALGGLTTNPRHPDGNQGTGQAPTAVRPGTGTGQAPTTTTRGTRDQPRPHAARRGTGDQPCPHSGSTKPKGPATPQRLPDISYGGGHAPTVATRSTGTGHASIEARQDPGERPRPHGGQTPIRGLATPPRRPDGAQETGHAPKAARHAPKHRQRFHGSQTWPGDWPGPHGSLTRPRKPATPSWRHDGVQGIGHAPHGRLTVPKGWPRPHCGRQGPGDRPRPHGNQTGSRGLDTPPQQPDGP